MTAALIAPTSPRPRGLLSAVMPRSLMGRALVILITPMLLVQIISTYIFFDRHWDTMTRRLAYAVAGEVALLADLVEGAPDAAALPDILSGVSDKLDLVATVEVGASLTNGDHPAWQSTLADTLGYELAQKLGRRFVMVSYIPDEWIEIRVETEPGILSILTPQRRLFSSTAYVFILWLIGSSCVLFAVAMLFMRNQIRPIHRLAIAAERLGRGLDVPNFRPSGAVEVRSAAAAFLIMHERIKRQVAQRTEMLAGVSHDLRTPLTRMKLQLALLGDGPDVEELHRDVAEMERMIDGYLAFARGEGSEQPARVDVDILVNDLARDARRQGVDVEARTTDVGPVTVRADALKRALANLVANAGKFAPHVWLTAGRRDGMVEFLVEDDGPGIPEDQREAVFRPFHRLDASRNQATGGVGLGLTIARDVARAHGGDLTLHESPRGGLRARLRVPA